MCGCGATPCLCRTFAFFLLAPPFPPTPTPSLSGRAARQSPCGRSCASRHDRADAPGHCAAGAKPRRLLGGLAAAALGQLNTRGRRLRLHSWCRARTPGGASWATQLRRGAARGADVAQAKCGAGFALRRRSAIGGKGCTLHARDLPRTRHATPFPFLCLLCVLRLARSVRDTCAMFQLCGTWPRSVRSSCANNRPHPPLEAPAPRARLAPPVAG